MPPKKKGNKKGNEDWESELGETPDSIAAAAQEGKELDVAKEVEDEAAGGGGLLAALKKNKSKKQKKGKAVQEDYVDGEDLTEVDKDGDQDGPNGVEDLEAKAPTEATTEDLFAAPTTKGKGGKGKQGKAEAKVTQENREDSGEEGTSMKSRKEKEKEKKEREKQRKKEQVSLLYCEQVYGATANVFSI